MSSSVTLVVKAPNQKIADQRVECTVDWTVKQLKQHLAKVYPTNPGESQQRIIYSGKLLQDDHRLHDVLKQYEPDQNVHIVHLVCMASMSHSQSLQDNSVPCSDGLRRRFPAESSSPLVFPDNVPHAFSAANYQSYFSHPGMMYYGTTNAVAPAVAGLMPYGAEQVQWLQQAYAQSMMQYMQQFQQAAAAAVQPNLIGQTQPAAPVLPAQPANQNFANEFAGAVLDQDPPIQPIGINQAGRAVNDDDAAEGGNGDWLDNTYMLVRFMMLMSILYFYSTPQRFVTMMIFAAIVYICRLCWMRRGRSGNQNREQREAAAAEPAAAAAAEPAAAAEAEPAAAATEAAERRQEAEVSEEAEQETVMVDLQATRRPSIHEVVWSIVSSFFTSLIPENPVPVNVN